jgi:hypothetical protein
MKNHNSMLNNITIGFRAKIVLRAYRNTYPRTSKIHSYMTFDLNFKVKPRAIFEFGLHFKVKLKNQDLKAQ